MSDVTTADAGLEVRAPENRTIGNNEGCDMPDQPAPEPEAHAAVHELAYPTGSLPQSILDCFLDGESAELSMSAIKAAMSHAAGNSVESAVYRLLGRGQLERISAGGVSAGGVWIEACGAA
jgi:L-alanine-DL-glutamate epimerase-like enolase superfamily enzyme